MPSINAYMPGDSAATKQPTSTAKVDYRYQSEPTSFEEYAASGGGGVSQTQSEYEPYSVYGSNSLQWDAPVFIDFAQGGLVPGLPMSESQFFQDPSRAYGQEASGFNLPGGGFSYEAKASGPSSVGDAIRSYYVTDEAQRANLQMMLVNAGFDLGGAPDGGWGSAFDSKYNSAWENAVMAAARTGVPLLDMLRQMGERNQGLKGLGGGGRGGGGGGGPKRPTVQLISEDDAREIIDQVAKGEMGRKLSDAEEKVAKGIIKAIHARQSSEQNRLIDQQMAGGGSATAPTNPQVLAKNEVEERFAAETGAYDVATAFVNFVRLAGGGGI